MEVASLVVMCNSGGSPMHPEYEVLLGIDGGFPSVEILPGAGGPAACLRHGVPSELQEVSQHIHRRLKRTYDGENPLFLGGTVRMQVYICVMALDAARACDLKRYRWISLGRKNLQELEDGTPQISEGINIPRSTFEILDDLADEYQ